MEVMSTCEDVRTRQSHKTQICAVGTATDRLNKRLYARLYLGALSLLDYLWVWLVLLMLIVVLVAL